MVPNGVCFYEPFSMGVLQRWDLKNHIMDKSSDVTPVMNTYTDMLNITYKIGQDFGTTDSTKIKLLLKVIRLFSKYSSPL